MTPKPHDFTRPMPLAPGLRVKLSHWLTRSNGFLAELLSALSVSIELKFEESSVIYPAECASLWTDKAFSIQVTLEGCEDQSLLALPNPLVQELVTILLGDRPEKPMAERDLSAGEISIASFIAETIIKSLKETWPDMASPGLKVGEPELNIRRTKRFRPNDPVVVCRSLAKTSLGESNWCWLLSSEFLAHLYGLPVRQLQPVGEPSRRSLDQLIRSMHTECEVRLGRVHLTAPQVAQLRVGDVVVLDQRVSEPLIASIRGEPKFQGWAGRVGNRQAFEIETIIQSRPQSDQDAA